MNIVDTVTLYGVDSPGFGTGWGKRFSLPKIPLIPALGPTQAPQMCTGLFQGVKLQGRGLDPPPPSRAVVAAE
jgi:hypothetical protein